MAEKDADFGDVPEALADFPRQWREVAVPQLEALEVKRQGAVRTLFIALAATAVIVLGWIIWRAGDGLHPFEIFAAFVIGILGVGGANIPLQNLRPKVKDVVVGSAMNAANLQFTAKGFEPDRFGDFNRLKLTPRHDKRSFEDRVTGAHAGMNFTLYEADLEQKRRSKNRTYYVTVFRGILGVVDYPSSALGETVLARDGGIFDKFSGPGGNVKRAGLVDSRFESTFTAWTNDQVEARYFLTPDVMETFLELETTFSGANIRGGFLPGEMIFALETGNWFEAGSMFKPLTDPARAKKLVEELGSVFHLIEVLKACAPKQKRDWD